MGSITPSMQQIARRFLATLQMRMLDEEVAWLLTPNDSLKVNEVFFVKAKLLGRLMVEKTRLCF